MRSLIVPWLLLCVTAASAQSNYGTITGSVSDTARTPVAGASIQAKNVDEGVVIRGQTYKSPKFF